MLRKFFPISGGSAAAGAYRVYTKPQGILHYTPNASAVYEVAVQAIAINGSGSYTYAWSAIVGDGGISYDGGTSSATAYIKVTGTGARFTFHGSATVTATDVGTGLTTTYDVPIEVQCGGAPL